MKTLTPTRFQYNLSLLNGGSTTVRVEQKVNGVYQYLATQQTQTTSGTYELSFVPNYEDIRISVSGTSRYALNNLYLDRDQIDTLVATYALSRGYRYGFQGQEKDDEVKGKGNSVNYTYRMHDPRIGRFFAVDPLAGKYPFYSPYAFSGNRVIDAVELEGLEHQNMHNLAGGIRITIPLVKSKDIWKGMTVTFGMSMNITQSSSSLLGRNSFELSTRTSVTMGLTSPFFRSGGVSFQLDGSISQNENQIGDFSTKASATYGNGKLGFSYSTSIEHSIPTSDEQSNAEDLYDASAPVEADIESGFFGATSGKGGQFNFNGGESTEPLNMKIPTMNNLPEMLKLKSSEDVMKPLMDYLKTNLPSPSQSEEGN